MRVGNKSFNPFICTKTKEFYKEKEAKNVKKNIFMSKFHINWRKKTLEIPILKMPP